MAWDNKNHNHLLHWVYNKSYTKPHHILCKQAGWDFPWYFYFSSSSSFPSWQLRPALGNVWRNVKGKTQSARWRIRRSQSGKTVPTRSVQKVCINRVIKLSKPQLNHNSTQPNVTLVGLDMKIILYTTPPHPTTHHRNSMLAISRLLLTRFW